MNGNTQDMYDGIVLMRCCLPWSGKELVVLFTAGVCPRTCGRDEVMVCFVDRPVSCMDPDI